jgi:glycosyltransferase involved in cell wall biosynthesis
MTTAVHIDVTNLLRDPIRTGIQRVERELIRHWPGNSRLVPVIAGRRHFRVLPREVLTALVDGTPVRHHFPFARMLRADPARLRLLNPELFFDPGRARLYDELIHARAGWIGWLLYDFLPWLAPNYFHPGASTQGMPFLATLREVPNVAHISAQTRHEYAARIMRGHGRDGPVVSLGGDGLGLERQKFSPGRRLFVALGTLEPRKNVAAILEAFGELWARGQNAELVVIGMLRSGTTREAELLHRFRNEKRLRYIGTADDATIRAVLGEARALVCATEAEGFGLPPLEALHAGIPVIATAMPSLDMLPPCGQIRLAEAKPPAIAAAVETMLDDATAASLWREAASVKVRSWQDFAHDVADWVMTSSGTGKARAAGRQGP